MVKRGMSVPKRRSRYFRKALVIPSEHGSWSWFVVPFLVGAGVAAEFNVALLLALLGGLTGFLLRQPATAWLRIRQGRGRRLDGRLAAGWTIGLALVAVLALLGLLALGRSSLLWLLLPVTLVLLLYLAIARVQRARVRSLWMEIAGATGLALMAPAAYGAASGGLTAVAWWLWALMALQNMLGVLYVRLRLADTHGRPAPRRALLGAHFVAAAAVLLLALARLLPWLAILPFLAFLARAIWATMQVRPVTDIRRFGFAEVGVEVLGGALVVLAYHSA